MIPRRLMKAATLVALAVLFIVVFNLAFAQVIGKWSFPAACLASFLVMWPVLNHFLKRYKYMKLFYKIDSKTGLGLIDRLGKKYARFWTFLADLAIVLSLGGLGAAFVAAHREKKGRRVLLAGLTFFVFFVYFSKSAISIYPIVFAIQPDLLALGIAALAGFHAYMLSRFLSKNWATFVAFALAVAFFGSLYFLSYAGSGELQFLFTGAIVGALSLPGVIIAFSAVHAAEILTGATTVPGLNPGYPDVEGGMPVLKYAGTDISIPLFPDILVAFIVMMTLHEFFHGLVSRARKIPLKNTGLLFMSIIPAGAFVEPNEKKFKKAKLVDKMRVYVMGSFANIFVVAVLALLLANLMVSVGVVRADGFVIGGVVNDSAAYGLLNPGEVVKSVGGVPTPAFWDFSTVMEGKRPGENLTIETLDRRVFVTLGTSPNNSSQGFVGLEWHLDQILPTFAPSLSTSHIEPSAGASVFGVLKWTFFLNLLLGIMNLLPMLPILDGWFLFGGIFSWLEKKLPYGRRLRLGQRLLTAMAMIIIALFFINASPFLP